MITYNLFRTNSYKIPEAGEHHGDRDPDQLLHTKEDIPGLSVRQVEGVARPGHEVSAPVALSDWAEGRISGP